MPYYLFEAKYTAAAIKAMVDNPQDREAAARKLFEAVGAKMHQFFFCMGERDALAVVEAPSDEVMSACALAVGASGAFSGGSTTKLMTSKEAMAAMQTAQKAAKSYVPATG